jgi:hypothetical protein
MAPLHAPSQVQIAVALVAFVGATGASYTTEQQRISAEWRCPGAADFGKPATRACVSGCQVLRHAAVEQRAAAPTSLVTDNGLRKPAVSSDLHKFYRIGCSRVSMAR